MRQNWTHILEVGQQGTPRDSAYLAHQYVWALEATGKGAEATPVLLQALTQMPGLLSGQGQMGDGSLYENLVAHLLQDGRKDEALQWAKLQYVLCPFDTAALERSTKLLARAWAANDSFAAIAAFSTAQSDKSAPNPLSEVRLPVLDARVLQEQQARLAALTGKAATPAVVSDLITLDLALGRTGAAMQRARRLLQERLDSPVGAQEVARVFKAADLNTLSANEFLAYLQGKGTNPFPAFSEKYDQGDTPTGAPLKVAQ